MGRVWNATSAQFSKQLNSHTRHGQLLPTVVAPVKPVKPSQSRSNQKAGLTVKSDPNPNPGKMLPCNSQTLRLCDKSVATKERKDHTDKSLYLFSFAILALFRGQFIFPRAFVRPGSFAAMTRRTSKPVKPGQSRSNQKDDFDPEHPASQARLGLEPLSTKNLETGPPRPPSFPVYSFARMQCIMYAYNKRDII